MSIYQRIKDTIVKYRDTGFWLQLEEAEDYDASLHEKIVDSEINPILWFSVAYGADIKNQFLSQYNDASGSPMLFAEPGDTAGSNDNYDFYGTGFGPESMGGGPDIDEDDIRWLLNGNNNVFSWTNFQFDNDDVWISIWGVKASTTYFLSTVGIMNILKEKTYAKRITKNGIPDDDRDMILNFIREFELAKKEAVGAEWVNYWNQDGTLDTIKKNLVKSVKDVGEIYDNKMSPMVPKKIYSLSVFYKKISTAVSFFLDYGLFNGSISELPNNPSSLLQLDEGQMRVVAYDSQLSTATEEDLGNFYCSNEMTLDYEPYAGVNLVWRAIRDDGYLFPSNFKAFELYGSFAVSAIVYAAGLSNWAQNGWIKAPGVPYQEGDETYDLSSYANLGQEDKDIIDFLEGNGEYEQFSDKGGEAKISLVKEANAGSLKISNRRGNGEPKNIEEYDTNASLYTQLRVQPYPLEEMILDKYVDFAVDIELNNLVSTQDPDDNTIYSLTRTIDNFAFEIAQDIAKIVAANKVNLVKATLFVSLDDIENDPNNEALDDALSAVAEGINAGAQLGYEEDELSKSELEERQKLLEQCALLLNLKTLDQKYNQKNKSELYKPSIHAAGYFGSRFLRINSNHQSKTITRLHTHREKLEEFLLMDPVVQSILSPKIRIQKIITQGPVIDTVEIPFNVITTNPNSKPIDYQTAMNGTSPFHGGAVGIKNMTFDFDGETPATAQKYVKSTLSIKLQDFKDLVTERHTTKISSINPNKKLNTTFRYIDLIVNSGRAELTPSPSQGNTQSTPSVDSIFREHYAPVDYRIKVDVGWNYIKNQNTINLIESTIEKYDADGILDSVSADDLFDAIDRQNKTFILAALDHDLNINDDGSIDLNINYFGFADALLSSYKFNALVTSKTETGIKKELEELLDQISAGQCSKTQLAKLQAAVEEKRQQVIKQSMSDIMRRMVANKLVRKVEIDDTTQLRTFKTSGAFTAVPKIVTSLEPGYQPKLNQQPKSFFFLGDLLYVLMDCMYDKTNSIIEGAENITFVLTDFAFTQYLAPGAVLSGLEEPDNNSSIIKINLASIPISVDFFKEWYTDEIIASEKYNYPLMEFLLVLCNKLLGDVLTEVCFNKKYDKTLFFRQSIMHSSKRTAQRMIRIANGTSAESRSTDQRIADLNQEMGLPIKSINSLAPYGILRTRALDVRNLLPLFVEESDLDDITKINTFVTIYCDTKSETHGGRGDYYEDLSEGIYHFHIGSNKGLLKKIKFNKTNIAGLRESRMYRYQGIADFAQLSNVYNVSLDLFGNFLFFPGMQIYVDPFGLGGDQFGRPPDPLLSPNNSAINYARLMGIGGYHLIKNVKVSIGVGGFTTNVEAIFIFSGDINGNDAGLNGILNIDPTVSRIESQLPADAADIAACQTVIDTYETNGGN